MFSKLSMKMKLYFGFGIVLVLLLAISTISFVTVSSSSTNFARFEQISTRKTIMTNIVDNLNMVRLAIYKFRITRDEEAKAKVATYTEEIMKLTNEILPQMKDKTRIENVTKFSELFKSYTESFLLSIKIYSLSVLLLISSKIKKCFSEKSEIKVSSIFPLKSILTTLPVLLVVINLPILSEVIRE